MHIIAQASNGTSKKTNKDPIIVMGNPIAPSTTIRSLKVNIDHRLSFKAHAPRASARLQGGTGCIRAISKRKGASPGALHQIITSTTLLALFWGSEAWWTEARHVLDQLTPGYHALTRIITGLPRWCPIPLLLQEAGLAPLELALDRRTQDYRIRLLLRPDDHQCKAGLLQLISHKQIAHQTGLRRVVHLVQRLIPKIADVEHTTHPTNATFLPQPEIPQEDEKAATEQFKTWAHALTNTIFLYTDGSKRQDGMGGSGWFCITSGPNPTTFQGHCNIGKHCKIEDAELHAIQEGLQELVHHQTSNTNIVICADNTRALRCLSGGRTNRRKYVRRCLEEAATLHGCKVRGKWSPSHTVIVENNIADARALLGTSALDNHTINGHTREPHSPDS